MIKNINKHSELKWQSGLLLELPMIWKNKWYVIVLIEINKWKTYFFL